MAQKNEHLLNLVKNRKSRIFAWAYIKKFFRQLFQTYFWTQNPIKKTDKSFDHQGPRYRRFSDFDLTQGNFSQSIFQKIKKIYQKSMKYGLFCSEFFTDHFYEVHFGPSGPTYAQNSKNCRKIGKNSPTLDSNFSRLGPKSKKPHDQNFRLFSVILKRLAA